MNALLLLAYNLVFLAGAGLYLIALAFGRRRGVLHSLPQELAERFAGGPYPTRPGSIWIHAASVGETRAVRGLVARLREAHPDAPILVTTSSWAGRREAARLDGVDLARLLPLDLLPLQARFARRARARALLVIETELWPSMLRAAKNAGCRLALVNGRLSEKSARRYAWIGGWMRDLLGAFDRILAQSEEDRARFAALGAPPERLAATGNIKWDLMCEQPEPPAAVRRRFADLGWGGAPLFVCGSTHPGEEEILLGAFRRARETFPALKLVLAPRHVERAEQAARTLAAAGVPFVRWSHSEEDPTGARALLVDELGVLGGLYAAADVVFVGGTLVPVGGHNLLEPAGLSKPVLFGPHTGHIAAGAQALLDSGGGLRVADEDALHRQLTRLLGSAQTRRSVGEKACAAVEGLRGATAASVAALGPILVPS